jgi:hypothetical protein
MLSLQLLKQLAGYKCSGAQLLVSALTSGWRPKKRWPRWPSPYAGHSLPTRTSTHWSAGFRTAGAYTQPVLGEFENALSTMYLSMVHQASLVQRLPAVHLKVWMGFRKFASHGLNPAGSPFTPRTSNLACAYLMTDGSTCIREHFKCHLLFEAVFFSSY